MNEQQQVFQSQLSGSSALRIGFTTEIQVTADNHRHYINVEGLTIPWRYILYRKPDTGPNATKVRTPIISYNDISWSLGEAAGPSVREARLYLASASLLKVLSRFDDTHGVILHGIPMPWTNFNLMIEQEGYKSIFSAFPDKYSNYFGIIT